MGTVLFGGLEAVLLTDPNRNLVPGDNCMSIEDQIARIETRTKPSIFQSYLFA